MSIIKKLVISAKEVFPLIEGGKGIGVTNGVTAGSWAAAGGIGTFSGVNADFYDADGNIVPIVYKGKTRQERHEELIAFGIQGGIEQAKIAKDISGTNGRIHMNILWEMGGAQRVLEGILDGAKGLIQGVTCGAGMPYKLAEIAAKYRIYYYPIISSMRAFRALWKRSYHNIPELLGGVVYEDPWKAGGHNGLSNSEDPNIFQEPYPRVVELRKYMNEVNLHHVPIIMAGGVWHLNEWENWLNNPEIGPIAFQFGTRPIVTVESEVPETWKRKLMTLKEGDVFLNRFSPTGFYSSAVNNNFIKELRERNDRQVKYSSEPKDELNYELKVGPRARSIYINKDDVTKVNQWINAGFDEVMKTPESTVIFVTKEKAQQIKIDQIECMGCLSACKFSNWMDHDDYNTGKKADPRSFCIQKTLQDIVLHGDVENNLMFSGHNAFRFGTDPYYKNGFIPTVKQLVERIATGY
jgi:NAD(P)H-dependent flavin oxidoreductase YrpB (nitropropane dioxygenase family)